VVAATGSALISLALFGLQLGILGTDLGLMSGTDYTTYPAQQLLDAASSLGPIHFIAELLAGGLLIAWMNRIYRKLPGLGARELRGSAGGAVGWWFVPLANLYVPFQYLREIWRALTPGLLPNDLISREKVSSGRIVGALWILAILSTALGFLVRAWGQKPVTIGDFIRLDAIDASFLASRAGYLILSIALMLAVQARQAKRFAELQLAAAVPATDA
jgi:hypothetical protein